MIDCPASKAWLSFDRKCIVSQVMEKLLCIITVCKCYVVHAWFVCRSREPSSLSHLTYKWSTHFDDIKILFINPLTQNNLMNNYKECSGCRVSVSPASAKTIRQAEHKSISLALPLSLRSTLKAWPKWETAAAQIICQCWTMWKTDSVCYSLVYITTIEALKKGLDKLKGEGFRCWGNIIRTNDEAPETVWGSTHS